MRKLCTVVGTLCVLMLISTAAFALDIQLSPKTLVLSSGCDQLTIHTDFPYEATEDAFLDIGDSTSVDIATWEDDCGNLVVRCSKTAVKDAVGNFEETFTTVDVTLTVKSGESTESATETLRVRK